MGAEPANADRKITAASDIRRVFTLVLRYDCLDRRDFRPDARLRLGAAEIIDATSLLALSSLFFKTTDITMYFPSYRETELLARIVKRRNRLFLLELAKLVYVDVLARPRPVKTQSDSGEDSRPAHGEPTPWHPDRQHQGRDALKLPPRCVS
ncbi:hypothetical protein [Bradyrhizobium sp.]|uniref:hypothetical protein n=1 Tax=Bradyrhizobium sp. TaxID=376 RepID=UPI002398F9A6|nr:hypothetical protein [Bradyrhizobium sp.]MDE2378207.1 hypothetical protein [Bradyrhizobium sp.]